MDRPSHKNHKMFVLVHQHCCSSQIKCYHCKETGSLFKCQTCLLCLMHYLFSNFWRIFIQVCLICLKYDQIWPNLDFVVWSVHLSQSHLHTKIMKTWKLCIAVYCLLLPINSNMCTFTIIQTQQVLLNTTKIQTNKLWFRIWPLPPLWTIFWIHVQRIAISLFFFVCSSSLNYKIRI